MAETDLWTEHVRHGDFAAAWRLSDAVLRARAGQTCWHLPRHQQWVWNGSPVRGKRVLVRCFHGLGDTVQFIRYVPHLRALTSEVSVWAQPALLELLSGVPGIDRLWPLHDGVVKADYDVDLEIMELPHLFRSTLDTVPNEVPYLRIPAVPNWSPPWLDTSGRFRVGVVWQSGDWDPARSVPLELLASLAEIPGVVLHALQRGPALARWPARLGPVSGSDDPLEAARVMNALDLILTVDSFPAHLAGALGRPVWTLLHANPDWRWLAGRDDSPWYPTMRLFRQEQPDAWEPVVGRVVRELSRDLRPAA